MMPENSPVACALSSDAMKEREAGWRMVMTTALQRGAATPNGVMLEFDPRPETGHALLDLVTAERGCCGWASWTLTSTSESTLVEASAVGPGVQVLHAMFEVAP